MSAPRENIRALVNLSAQLGSGDLACPALIQNISQTGALVLSTQPLQKGETRELTFSLAPGVSVGPLNTKCIWANKTQMGLSFERLTPLQTRVLEKLVYYHRL